MKKLLLILTAVAGAVLLLAGISPADGFQYRSRGTHAYHGDHHDGYRRRNVVEIVSVAQINPAYLSVYQGPDAYDSVTQAAILAEIKALSARLDQLNALYLSGQAGARAPGAPPTSPAPTAPGAPAAPTAIPIPPPTPGGTPGLLIPPTPAVDLTTPAAGLATMRSDCTACHTQGKLDAGTKFNLFTPANGKPQQLVSLTAQQKLNVIGKVQKGLMPKQPNSFGIKPYIVGTPEGDAKAAGIINFMLQ